jgi:hypothetical protein
MSRQSELDEHKLTLSWLRGQADGAERVGDTLRKKAGEEFARGNDDRAHQYRDTADIAASVMLDLKKEAREFAQTYGLEVKPCDE